MRANTKVKLERASSKDAKMIFSWRNLPEIIALGTTQKPILWKEHLPWFKKILRGRKSHLLLIILKNKKPIGQVRFDKLNNSTLVVSIYLLPKFTGHGLGVIALNCACKKAFDQLCATRIIAVIRKNNLRSLSAFQKSGFEIMLRSSSDTKVPPRHLLLQINPPQQIKI